MGRDVGVCVDAEGSGGGEPIQRHDATCAKPQGESPAGLLDLVLLAECWAQEDSPGLCADRIQEVSGPGNCYHVQPSVQFPCKMETLGTLTSWPPGWGTGQK